MAKKKRKAAKPRNRRAQDATLIQNDARKKDIHELYIEHLELVLRVEALERQTELKTLQKNLGTLVTDVQKLGERVNALEPFPVRVTRRKKR